MSKNIIFALTVAASLTATQMLRADPPESLSLLSIRKTIDKGRPEEALKQLDLLAATQPQPKGIDTIRGLAFYAEDHLLEADAAFASALKQSPDDREASQMRGLVLFRLGRPSEAIPLLQASSSTTAQAKFDPSYVLALCYLDTRRYDDARRAFAAQYAFPPDSAPAYLLAARMLLRREYLPIAEQFAHKSLELDPKLPLAHTLLAEIALAGQHVPDAIVELEKERERNPLEPGLYDRLGDAYSRQGDFAKAQQSLQRAVLLEPNATGPYILLGKVMLKREDPVGALVYLQRAEKMDTANFMTHSLLAQAYRAVGRTEDAARELTAAQKLQASTEPHLEPNRQ